MLLVEVLNDFSGGGAHLRSNATSLINDLKIAAGVEIVEQTPDLFERAAALCRARADKAWRLTDCASFVIIKEMQMTEALSYDQHFEQMGFAALMRAD